MYSRVGKMGIFKRAPGKKEIEYTGGFKKIRTSSYSVPTTHPYTPGSFIPLLFEAVRRLSTNKAIQEDKTLIGTALNC